jgi:iron-sulfur cluster assembly accessory protein
MINITETAAAHLKGISDANEGKIPMLGVKGGGCAGFSYDWQLIAESDINDMNDEIIELSNGHKIVVDGTSLMYLFGSTIDLKQDLFGTTLDISTPAAQSMCGCGESINFDMEMVEDNMMLSQGFRFPDE